MSTHRSLKTLGALARHRNVLSRQERLKILERENRWKEGEDSLFGLVKVSHRKTVGKKKKKKAKEQETTEVAAPTPPKAKTEGEKK